MPVLTGSDIPADSTVAGYARDVAIGIADYARSLGGGKPSETASRDAAASPADLLFDLRLPDSLRSWLKPAADALGLTIEDGKARGKYGGRRDRQLTILTDGGDVRRTLLHIDKRVLNDPKAHDALGMVAFALEKKEFVAVFGEDVLLPVPVNANLIDGLWKEWVDSRFIAWSFVSELPTLDLVDQIEFMRTRLDLEALTPRTHSASAGAGEVAVKDLDRIVAILMLGDFNDVRGRKALLAQAGLDSFASGINLEGAPKKTGLDLVMYLAQQQDRVPPDRYTALGALLRTVMALPDIPPNDAGWLKALITRCEL